MFEEENLTLEEEFEDGGQGGVVAAQEIPEDPVDDGQEGVVDPLDVDEDEDGLGAGGSARGKPGAAARMGRRSVQSHEDNAAARAARIRTEQDLRRQYDDTVAALGVTNPLTGAPFKNFEEFVAYGRQFQDNRLAEEARQQGVSVEELREKEADRDFLRRLRREDAQKVQAQQERQQREAYMRADLAAFTQAHPEVDVAALEGNPKFRKFAGNRLYNEPLIQLYEDFVDLVNDAQSAAVTRLEGRRERSTGSGQGGSGAGLTPSQRASLAAWNRENPDMKMTAKEFLSM